MPASDKKEQLEYHDIVKIVATIHEKPQRLKPDEEATVDVKKVVVDALKELTKDDKELIDLIIDCYSTFVEHLREAAEKGSKNSDIDCKKKVGNEKIGQILSDILNNAIDESIKKLKNKSNKNKYYYRYILDSLKKAYSKVLRDKNKKYDKNAMNKIKSLGWLFDTCYDETRGERLQCALQHIQERLDSSERVRAYLAFLLLLASYVEMIRDPGNVAYFEWYPYLLRGVALAEGACKDGNHEIRPVLPVCPARGDAAAIAYYVILRLTLDGSGPLIDVREDTVRDMLWSLLHKKK